MAQDTQLPVIKLELMDGTLRIRTEHAIYEIGVDAAAGLARSVDTIVQSERAPAPPPEPAAALATDSAAVSDQDLFFKELSEEMLNEIGKLARQLSLSIRDVPPPGKNVDLTQAGTDLENAKGLLGNIVKMTESATMQIMDLTEQIHSGCETVSKNVERIRSLEFVERPMESGDGADWKDEALRLARTIHALATQCSAPADAPVTVYRFDPDIIFQTVYELCTNESVKKHIKAMWDGKAEAFDMGAVTAAFSAMAPEIEQEESFFNFPLEMILKTLYQHATVDSHKQVLKKMHKSAGTIFLDQVLPVEGTVEQQAPAPAAGSDGPDALVAATDELIALLERDAGTVPLDQGYSLIRREEHEALVTALESSDDIIKKIVQGMQHILETLSFQDLSGQQIMKIADILSSVQVQLLSILVSFGVKFKAKAEDSSLTTWDAEAETSEQVTQMMNRLGEEGAQGEGESTGPLDQAAVDQMLAELGF